MIREEERNEELHKSFPMIVGSAEEEVRGQESVRGNEFARTRK